MKLVNRPHLAAALLLLCAQGSAQELMLELVYDGIDTATSVTAAPGESGRLFVTTSGGLVHIIQDGVLLPAPFLDLSGDVSLTEGIPSLAFHPDYATNGRFFIIHKDASDFSHLLELAVSADPDLADPSSAVEVIAPFLQPGLAHNWNCIKFGPDGMLYMSTGDGGGYHGPPPDSGPSQDLSSTQGKILRLDMSLPAPHIPSDNPFVGQANVAEEVWVYGLRQPWRFSFDSVTSDVFISDVGQTTREEIDFIPGGHAGGLNFGWACREGSVCTGVAGCSCSTLNDIAPIHEYPHGNGLCCIIGGEVYRGPAMPALHGTYFYADYCSARVWSLRYDGSNLSEHIERSQEFETPDGIGLTTISSFGTDADGELYVIGNFPSAIFKVVENPGCGTNNYCETAPNSVGPGALIRGLGSTSVTANDFILEGTQAPTHRFGLFYYGLSPIQTPFADGNRCVGGGTWRLNPAAQTNGNGRIIRAIDLQNQSGNGALLPGATWHFQLWFRDPNGPIGTGSNLSDGLTATFCP